MGEQPPRLSKRQARRIALTAQGFARQRPTATTVTATHLNRVIARLGLFQIDSVNVLVRAHYMPAFSRLGAYDRELLHRAAGRAPRRLVEYWAHEAALLDVRLWPAFAFRRNQAATKSWGGPRRIGAEQPDLVAAVAAVVNQHGPLTPRQLEQHFEPVSQRPRDHWGWNWSDTKSALEYLFFAGDVMAKRRNAQFEREFDVPERVLPADIGAAEPMDEVAAHLKLIEHAARAHGVGTLQCFRDYFRLAPEPSAAALTTLVAQGVLEPVTIEGWRRPAFRHHEVTSGRNFRARALLSPFDPLVFERTRTEQLFDFRYRIEIYVPQAKREYGYYVLPFLLGDQLAARVDLKADRQDSALIVHGAWAEASAPAQTASELAAELQLMAAWLDLSDIRVGTKGDLVGALASELA